MFVDLSTRIVELQTETLFCFDNILELQTEMKELRKENRCYKESNEELEVATLAKRIEEGRNLLNTQTHNSYLVAELETMDKTEVQQLVKQVGVLR